MELTIIATVAQNGAIGRDDELPWDLPQDRNHYRQETSGHPIVLGRRTYENRVRNGSGPLPGRKHVVLTNDDTYTTPEPVDTCSSIGACLTTLRALTDTQAYIAGGESIYEQFLPIASELLITKIDRVYEADAYFPPIDTTEWAHTDQTHTNGLLTFNRYTKRSPSE